MQEVPSVLCTAKLACLPTLVPCDREQIVNPTSQLRAADILSPTGLLGRPSDLCQQRPPLPLSVIPATPTTAANFLKRAETEKGALYNEMCTRYGCQFQPTVITTLGGLHESGISFPRELFLIVTLDCTGHRRHPNQNGERAPWQCLMNKVPSNSRRSAYTERHPGTLTISCHGPSQGQESPPKPHAC